MREFNFLSCIQSRYPCSTRNTQAYHLPEYDGFCLDINSILVAHILYSDESFSNQEIIGNIVNHVDFLFRSLKPTKFVFIAFDGVLPDAKLNYLKNKLLAIKDNLCSVYNENPCLDKSWNAFDISRFTAGSCFTSELFSHLKHFIAHKISTNSVWQKRKIFINGPEIPGESKIKITQFIRYYKANNNSQITKYCLYTFDPDLLLLSLSTHEPYISIIQDRTYYSKIKDSITPEETNFSVTHLSLIREYLKMEFSLYQGKLTFDFEKMLDDWILIGILISTYSLPCFSYLNVNNGALSVVFKTYLTVLGALDGYINEFGKLEVNRFQKFMDKLSKIEMKVFESDGCEILEDEKIKDKLKSINIDKMFSKANKGKGKGKLPAVLNNIRKEYYKELESQSNNNFDLVVPTMVSEYVKSIQWILNYYYRECCSWSWSYSYSKAPLISDMLNLERVDLSFEVGKPLDTTDFLSSVLPLTYNIQNILSDECKSEEDSDTKKKICLFLYSKSKADFLTEQYGCSSFVNHADLKFIKTEDLTVDKEVVLKESITAIGNNLSGFPSFSHIPFKFHLELEKNDAFSSVEKKDYDDLSSENEVLVLDVTSHVHNTFEDLAEKLLGKTYFVNWPYIEEAYVHSITNFKTEILLKSLFAKYNECNTIHKKLSESEIKKLKETVTNLERTYDSIGIRFGTSPFLLGVNLKLGTRRVYEPLDTMKSKNFYNWHTTVYVPYQLLAQRVNAPAPTLRYDYVHNIFSVSNLCFMTQNPHYGSLQEIKSPMSKNYKISVRVNVVNEPKNHVKALFKTNNLYSFEALEYLNVNSIAEMLQLKPFIVHVICQSLFIIEKTTENGVIVQKKHNVGLRLKYPNDTQEQTLAYSMKTDSMWFFSKLAVELIRNYVLEFPEIIELIDGKTIEFDASKCLKDAKFVLRRVNKWLKETSKTIKTVQKDIKKFILHNVNVLDEIIFKNNSKSESGNVDFEVSPDFLFKPGTTTGLVAPVEKERHDLLDRIVCVKENFTVPLGLRGTIINIISSDIDKSHNIYEVIFDFAFSGGLTLYGSAERKCYRLRAADFMNISYGNRNKKNDIKDQNKEKVKMKRSMKFVNKNVQKKENKKSSQNKDKIRVKDKLPKLFTRKGSNFDFSVN